MFLVSCASDEKDIMGAVSVFKYSKDLKIDESLSGKTMKIPAQKHNKFWFGGSKAANNFNAENFAFASQITKTKSIWSGYRTGNNDQKVFKPLIINNVVYLLDAKGNLIARNLENYKKIWKRSIFDKKDRSNFIDGKIYYNDGKIFATSGFNYLAAIDAKDGKIIWSKKIGSIPVSTPVANKGQVFVTTSDNKTYVLDAKSGQINWIHSGINKNTAILGAADPVFYKNYVITSYSSGEIYILDQGNGDIGWSHDLNVNRAINSDFILNDIDATPMVKDGVAYAVGNGGLMMAISIEDGNILWEKEMSSIADFWISGDFIYLVNNENQLICLDRNKGGIKWYVDLEKEKDPKKKAIYNGVIMAGDNLILSNSKREIIIASAINGEILQRKKVSKRIFHTPIIVDKKLYLNTLGRFTVNLIILQ
jgi:outer membrane protein assembly factor BamB